VTWEPKKARERFNLAHARLGKAQVELQAFLEKQLEAPGKIRCYGTTSNLSQQLKNKLGQAITIPGGMLTLSLETRAIHDKAIATLADDWAENIGWPKAVACVAVIHPADAGWKVATIVEWSPSVFPELVQKRLFPDVKIVQAKGSPSAGVFPEQATALEFQTDERGTEPSDRNYCETEFRKGWAYACDSKARPLSAEELRQLRWKNLGYRLGRLFGITSDEMVGTVFDWTVRQKDK